MTHQSTQACMACVPRDAPPARYLWEPKNLGTGRISWAGLTRENFKVSASLLGDNSSAFQAEEPTLCLKIAGIWQEIESFQKPEHTNQQRL